MRYVLTLLLVLLISIVSATCSENQIDVNSASLEELDNLIGIGPAKGQAIIDSRPYTGVDDLIDVYGIGEITLDKIKTQGLACVEGEESTPSHSSNEEETEDESEEEIEKEVFLEPGEPSEVEEKKRPIQPETIKLNNPENLEIIGRNNYSSNEIYSIYGFIGLSILIVILFLAKLYKNTTYKNEFR